MKTFLKFLFICCFVHISQANAREMLLEDIAALRSVISAEVSPDGKWIAYTKSVPRKPYIDDDGEAWVELHVLASDGKSRSFISGKVNVNKIQWSHDSTTIYYTAKRGDDKHHTLYAIPIDGGESSAVISFKTDIGAYTVNHDGSQIVFLAKQEKEKHRKDLEKKGFKAKIYEEELRYSHVWLKDLNNKEKEPEKLNVEGHVSSVKFSPNGELLLLQVAPTSLVDDSFMSKKLQIVNLKGKTKAIFKTEGKLGKSVWSTDGKKIIFLAANDLNDPTSRALYVGSLNGSFRKRIENIDSHVMDIETALNNIYLIEHKGLESRVIQMGLSEGGSKKILVNYGKGIQRSISVSDDGYVYVKMDTSQHPPEIYRLANNKFQRKTNSNSWLSSIDLGKQVSFNYKARDGLDLEAVLVYPLNYQKGKRYPMIAFIHGGPETHHSNGWNLTYSWPLHVASAQGYISLIPNYRGSTGRGLKFSKLDQHAYADPEFTDILDGKLALVEQGMVDKARAGITGGSYGGYATAWSSTALSEHYAAGVMFVGISNQLSKFGTSDIANEMYHVHSRAWPWDEFQWMLERSPIYHVKKARTPLLIMHGESDTRVHPSQSMELYRYLKLLNQAPVRLVFYPGEGHGNRKAAAQLDYSMRLMRWMDFYLKGKGEGIPNYDLKHQDKLKKENGE